MRTREEEDQDFLDRNFGKLLLISIIVITVEFLDSTFKKIAKLFKK